MADLAEYLKKIYGKKGRRGIYDYRQRWSS